MGSTKQQRFNRLVARVQQCGLCSRMDGRRRVLSSLNGPLDSGILFVAEAPGRLGADKFGIPLYGDQTGRNFEMLLTSAGIDRGTVFITNAVVCNPRTPRDTNDSPSQAEIRACSQYLQETIDIVGPKVVVPLGSVALAALGALNGHSLILSEHVAKLLPWGDYLLFPLFHPGPRGSIRRPKPLQQADYRTLAVLVTRLHDN